MIHNLYHILIGRLNHHKLEPYPHPVKWKAYLDQTMIFISIIGPITTIPQLYDVWYIRKTAGVSITSWTLYMVSACLWLIYGTVHKSKPIILNSLLWVIFDGLVVIGVLIYN